MKPLFFAALLFSFLIPSDLPAQEVADKKFWAANTLLVGATIFDVESTYFALDRCGNSCREGNPIMRPLIKRGRPLTYAFQGSVDAGMIYLSYRLKKNGNKLWYVVPVIVAAAHSTAGANNIKIALRF